jgi:hypothetical protein
MALFSVVLPTFGGFPFDFTAMSEEYAEKMSRKSLPELLLYVRNRAEYREDAVLAALDELEQRGQVVPEAAGIRAELLPVVEQQRQAQQMREAETTRPGGAEGVPGLPAAEGPALYSPGTIVLFSMLFSFLAGGILMVLNMFRLKEAGKAGRLVLFIVGFLLASSYGLQLLMASYGMQQMRIFSVVSVVVNLLAVLAYLLYFWPRYVGPRPYVSRQWLPAMLVCFVVMLMIYRLAVAYFPGMTQ